MNKRKKTRWGFLAVAVVIAYFGVIAINQQKAIYEKEKEIGDLANKIKQEEKLNKELEAQKKILNTDEYAIKVAREKLGMVKPGEKIFIDTNK